MIIEPCFQRRQILAPINRAVGQMLVTVTRSAGDFVEVGEIIWPDRKRFPDLPKQNDPDRGGEDCRAILASEMNYCTTANEERRINRKKMAMPDVKVTRNCNCAVNKSKHRQW